MTDTSPTDQTYNVYFTAGALLFDETLRLLPILRSDNALPLLKEEVQENRLFMISSLESRKRLYLEIRRRHLAAPPDFWEVFGSVRESEQRILLFYLCMKTYVLVFDLHFELSVSRWKKLLPAVTINDVLFWVDQKSDKHPEILAWSEQTLRHIANKYRRMLSEAGLRNAESLQPPPVNPGFFTRFADWGDPWMKEAAFL
ncbi:MAG: DUF1819 family protein [Candidatus Cyclonatronum sp.]|uniref:BrxA family protein n=1 Tax=Cyclonatronum sp. TaxID=3024185 RepID=UPI0025C3E630|nr:BrxA family protein [Cyclonatronum sp.]MCH8487207.1 DUF1819 family protein [Cyclonatronum sp.]